MPKNVPAELEDKFKACKEKVMASGKDEEAAYGICYTSVVEGKSLDEAIKQWVEAKIGARHSLADKKKLNDAHDALVAAGADCGSSEKAIDYELPAYVGEAVKSLDDNGKVGGYLVRFSTENDPDLTGDYFTKNTDFGETDKLPVLYHHGFDKSIGKRKIGAATIKKDDVGLWVEAQLNMRDDYEKSINELVKAGKLGWSSGAASHTVDREHTGKAAWVKQWYLAEASLTPAPAEYRNHVVPVKSLIPAEAEAAVTAPEADTKTNIVSPMEGYQMDEKQIAELVEKTAAEASAKAVDAFVKSLPEAKSGFVVTGDEADRALEGNPFKSAGEFLKAVADVEISHNTDKRLLPLKASGLNESIPSQGGFLVPTEYASGIRERMYNTGSILSKLNVINVTGNNMVFNAVDETSRVTGSRKGGIQGYWLNEGGTKTDSKPKFNQINLKLKKVAAVSYATDELLADTSALSDFLMRGMADELKFLAEDAVINGDGVGKPLGILNSPALVSATRTDANEVDSLDIARMWARRWVGANDYVWLIDPSVYPQLTNMTVGNFPIFIPGNSYSSAPGGTLYGRPVMEVEYTKQLGTLGDIMLVSFSEIAAIAKGGVELASSIHVKFLQDEQAFRAVYRFDAQPFWNSDVTPANGSSDTVSPFIALAATT